MKCMHSIHDYKKEKPPLMLRTSRTAKDRLNSEPPNTSLSYGILKELSIMKKWDFPIETNEFVTYQEKLCGRSLNDSERDMAIWAADIINEAYIDGKAGMTTGLFPRDPKEILIEMPPALFENKAACRYMVALIALSTAAWEQGQKEGVPTPC